jgi:hypothetical protein
VLCHATTTSGTEPIRIHFGISGAILFVWFINHQLIVVFFHNKLVINYQPGNGISSCNTSALAISHEGSCRSSEGSPFAWDGWTHPFFLLSSCVRHRHVRATAGACLDRRHHSCGFVMLALVGSCPGRCGCFSAFDLAAIW